MATGFIILICVVILVGFFLEVVGASGGPQFSRHRLTHRRSIHQSSV